MRSLTGFGAGDAPLGEGRLVAEVRSVNHRFLEARARLPDELADLTLFAEQILREKLRRGRVELVVRAEGAVLPSGGINRARARAAFAALGELRDELAPGAELPLSLLSAVPNLFAPPSAPELEAAREALRTATLRAISAMDGMRRQEGRVLAEDLARRVDLLRTTTRELAERTQTAAHALQKRARDRIASLLEDHPGRPGIDSGRVEAEIALLAERSDVTEELTRLESHLIHWDAIVAEASAEEPVLPDSTHPTQPIGRRLDFLLQEMVRETNTLGAKAQDAAVSQRVVAMKAELERLREQVQNVE